MRAPSLQNVVGTVKLGCDVALEHVARSSWNVEYNPRTFSAAIMRLRNPNATVLLFASGSAVIVGCRSASESRTSARRVARRIRRLGYPVQFGPDAWRIHNLVASTTIPFPVRLEGMAFQLGDTGRVAYEPELFPGLIYRMEAPRVALLIFVSGKVIITGAKSEEEVAAAHARIVPILEQYRK